MPKGVKEPESGCEWPVKKGAVHEPEGRDITHEAVKHSAQPLIGIAATHAQGTARVTDCPPYPLLLHSEQTAPVRPDSHHVHSPSPIVLLMWRK